MSGKAARRSISARVLWVGPIDTDARSWARLWRKDGRMWRRCSASFWERHRREQDRAKEAVARARELIHELSLMDFGVEFHTRCD